jgi:hypothetical protein
MALFRDEFCVVWDRIAVSVPLHDLSLRFQYCRMPQRIERNLKGIPRAFQFVGGIELPNRRRVEDLPQHTVTPDVRLRFIAIMILSSY